MARKLGVLFAMLLFATGVRGSTAPLNRIEVVALLAGGAPADEVAELIKRNGINFQPTPAFLKLMARAESSYDYGRDELAKVISAARVVNPVAAESPSASQILEHLARGAELEYSVFPPDPTKYQPAEGEFREALQIDPGNPLLHFALGKVLWDEGKWALAGEDFGKTVMATPDLAIAHVQLGGALAAQGHLREAIAELVKAVQLEPGSATTRNALANVLLQNHDVVGAIQELREGLRLNPDSASLHNSLGTTLYVSGDVNTAITELQDSIRLGSKDPETYIDLADALRSRGNLDWAISELRDGVRSHPGYFRLHYGLGEMLIDKKNLPAAEAELRESIRLMPSYAPAYSELGYVLRRRHDVDGAIAEYREAIRLNPDFARAHANLGAAYWRKHDNKDGYKEVLIAHELAPNDPAISMQFDKLPESWKRKASQPAEILKPASAPIGEPPKPDFVYYLDEQSNSLVPLEAEMPTMGAKVGPFRTTVYSTVIGERSPVRFKAGSKWEFLIRPAGPSQILNFRLERFQSKGGSRTVSFGKKSHSTSNPGKPGFLNYLSAPYDNSSTELTIPYDLVPGEYGFLVSAKGGGGTMFCFGVDSP